MEDVYIQLANHLEGLVMGYPFRRVLIKLLKEMFSPVEAEVALAIPNNLLPLEVVEPETIAARSTLPYDTVVEILETLAERNLLYSAITDTGSTGYALLQVGYGMPQIFFWEGENESETAYSMAKLVNRYFTKTTNQQVYSSVRTKACKYIPVNLTVDVPIQGVLLHERIDSVIKNATKIAVAYCPCRVSAKILGQTECQHSLEVCFKFDDMADFVIAKKLARELSKDEAFSILKQSEEEGLVHMVDNVQGHIKHMCNCCGHYCWNVGIIRRRKVRRDALMAVYFIRDTDINECIGCGACVDRCPVDAVKMENKQPVLDLDWCIGCGVCLVSCPNRAISLKRRSENKSPIDFAYLHHQIKVEKRVREREKSGIDG